MMAESDDVWFFDRCRSPSAASRARGHVSPIFSRVPDHNERQWRAPSNPITPMSSPVPPVDPSPTVVVTKQDQEAPPPTPPRASRSPVAAVLDRNASISTPSLVRAVSPTVVPLPPTHPAGVESHRVRNFTGSSVNLVPNALLIRERSASGRSMSRMSSVSLASLAAGGGGAGGSKSASTSPPPARKRDPSPSPSPTRCRRSTTTISKATAREECAAGTFWVPAVAGTARQQHRAPRQDGNEYIKTGGGGAKVVTPVRKMPTLHHRGRQQPQQASPPQKSVSRAASVVSGIEHHDHLGRARRDPHQVRLLRHGSQMQLLMLTVMTYADVDQIACYCGGSNQRPGGARVRANCYCKQH